MDVTVQKSSLKPFVESSLNSYTLDVALKQFFFLRYLSATSFTHFLFLSKNLNFFLETSVIHRKINVNSHPEVFRKNLGDSHKNIFDAIFFQYGVKVSNYTWKKDSTTDLSSL